MNKKRIILRPTWGHHARGKLAVVERYLNGALIGVDKSSHVFDSAWSAVQFADAAAHGVVDDLIRHFGDVYTFAICHWPAAAEQLPTKLRDELL